MPSLDYTTRTMGRRGMMVAEVGIEPFDTITVVMSHVSPPGLYVSAILYCWSVHGESNPSHRVAAGCLSIWPWTHGTPPGDRTLLCHLIRVVPSTRWLAVRGVPPGNRTLPSRVSTECAFRRTPAAHDCNHRDHNGERERIRTSDRLRVEQELLPLSYTSIATAADPRTGLEPALAPRFRLSARP